MPQRRSRGRGPTPVVAGALGVASALLLAWPVVAAPPLTLSGGFLALLVAWALAIAALAALSRRAGTGDEEPRPGDPR